MQKRILYLILAVLLIPSFSFGHPKNKIKTGGTLPDLVLIPVFAGKGIPGDTITNSSLKGKKILLTFNRFVNCPLCNFRTHQLLEKYDTLSRSGLVIISVYESSKENLKNYTTQEDVPFIMIADPQGLLYKQFSVKRSWIKTLTGLFHHYREKHSAGAKLFKSRYESDGHLNRIGADFLIDEQGIIQIAYYGKFVGDHLSVEEIVKWATGN